MKGIGLTTAALMLFVSLGCAGASEQYESILNESGFNGSAIVQVGSEVVHHGSYGYANMQFDVPNDNNTRFRIASVTKLFTVVMMMQLKERGLVQLDGTIGKYLPRYKGEGRDRVTLYHLLTATSGLTAFDVDGEDVYESKLSSEQILTMYCSGPLIEEPGSRFIYNNADFFILGKIIEEITQKTFDEALSELILKPLKMKDTGLVETQKIIKRLAYAYDDVGKPPVVINDPLFYMENYGGAGAMYSTTADMLKFANAIYDHKLVNADTVNKMTQPFLSNHAFGQWVYAKDFTAGPQKIIERQGSIEGTGARLLHLPESNITLVLLSNTWSTDLDALQYQLLAQALSSLY